MDRFVRNPTFKPRLLTDAQYRAALRARAELVQRAVAARSPSRVKDKVQIVETARGPVVEVQSPFWHIFEYGSINNAPLAPLRTGARTVGLHVEEHGKT